MCKVQAFPLPVTSSQMKTASMAGKSWQPSFEPQKEEGSRHPGKRKGRVGNNEICRTPYEYKELFKLLG